MENKTKKTDNRRRIEGVVTGNSMEKTVKVRVDTLESHPVYKKRIRRKKVYFAHTEQELEIGDKVVIKEASPYSKKKRWVVESKVGEEEK